MISKQERKRRKAIRKENRSKRKEEWRSKAKQRRAKIGIFFRILFRICKPLVQKVTKDIIIPLATDRINERIKGTKLDLTLKNEDIKEEIISLIDSV